VGGHVEQACHRFARFVQTIITTFRSGRESFFRGCMSQRPPVVMA
jgi:hypothetical protein